MCWAELLSRMPLSSFQSLWVILNGERDFADVAKLRDKIIILDYPGKPNIVTRFLIRGKLKGQREDMKPKAEVWEEREGERSENALLLVLKNGWRRHESRNAPGL